MAMGPDLRSMVLALAPTEAGLAPTGALPHVWGALMDIGSSRPMISISVPFSSVATADLTLKPLAELEAIVDTLVAANAGQVEKYRAGNTKLLGFFVGQVMKATKGQADAAPADRSLTASLQALARLSTAGVDPARATAELAAGLKAGASDAAIAELAASAVSRASLGNGAAGVAGSASGALGASSGLGGVTGTLTGAVGAGVIR